ncbi:hypothetical protein [Paludibaculum fermentans]|uniref:hypothetical protein n=1 Tax=Paludibaculum fermentans TaxID=1473598 RepID=UPI003EB8A628
MNTLSLAQVTGQQLAIEQVRECYKSRTKEVVLLVGERGTGVSWCIEKASAAWQACGGVALLAKGESFAKDRRLFPWISLAEPGAPQLARIAALKTGLAHSSKAVPMLGSVTSYLVEELLNYRKKKLARESIVLSEQEQDLLFVIENAGRNDRLLVAIDNVESWDDSSMSLLRLIMSRRLDATYSAISSALFLVGVQPGDALQVRSLAGSLPLKECPIKAVDKARLPLAANALGLPALSSDELDRLYSITDGRLDLLADIGDHLRNTGPGELPSDLDSLYDHIMDRRVQSTIGSTSDLAELLMIAAVVGETIWFEDLRCLTGHPQERLIAELRLADSQHLLKAIGDTVRFRSNALHRYFHRAGTPDHPSYHSKFAQCLQVMRPGEYEYRLHHLVLASKAEDALTCYTMAALSARRARRLQPHCESISRLAGWAEMRLFLRAMFDAYDAYDARQLATALSILDGVEPFLPAILVAERDYLEAQILLKSHRSADHLRAVEILQRWQVLKSQEGELWSRISQALMIALVQVGRLEDARNLEADLTSYYWSHRNVDPWALFGLNALRLRSESLHHLPTATLRIESALAYFGRPDISGPPRHPLQYYYALSNLVANLLANGRFHEARRRSQELDVLVRDYPQFHWPVLEIPSNNFVLAAYLTGEMDATTAESTMKQIASGGESADQLLMENNRGVYLMASGHVAAAIDALETVYQRVVSMEDVDHYHRYFICNNLAICRALTGDIAYARQTFIELSTSLGHFYPALQRTIEARHALMRKAVESWSWANLQDLDAFLTHHSAIGPQWRFYGRSLLFSDIQFWSTD